MKALLLRNFRLRLWTVIIYIFFLVIYPIYSILPSASFVTMQIHLIVSFILTIIYILDAGHMFRMNRRLGNRQAYLFFESLPVSKKDMLNAHYITCLIFTLVGALIINLYGYKANTIQADTIYFSSSYSFIISNFLSVPIVFSRSTEYRSRHIPYFLFVICIVWLLPFVSSVVLILINYFVLKNETFPITYAYILNIGFLVLSIVCFVINYILQILKLNRANN